jgi:hypothetical protein
MLRTVGAGAPTLWESILPSAVLGMPGELERVDQLLDDGRFIDPYRVFFHATLGRPSIPLETYLRLIVFEVSASVGLRVGVRRGSGLDHLAAVRSDSSWWTGAASDHLDEDHDPLR